MVKIIPNLNNENTWIYTDIHVHHIYPYIPIKGKAKVFSKVEAMNCSGNWRPIGKTDVAAVAHLRSQEC